MFMHGASFVFGSKNAQFHINFLTPVQRKYILKQSRLTPPPDSLHIIMPHIICETQELGSK